MSDYISITDSNKRIHKVLYALLEVPCTNALLCNGLIIYYNYNASLNRLPEFDENNVEHVKKIIIMHSHVKPYINKDGGLKKKQISPGALDFLDRSVHGYNLFRKDIDQCYEFLCNYVYTKKLYWSALKLEWFHWLCNLYDSGEGSTSSKGYIRPQLILMLLIICLGINMNDQIELDKSVQICNEFQVVSVNFFSDG